MVSNKNENRLAILACHRLTNTTCRAIMSVWTCADCGVMVFVVKHIGVAVSKVGAISVSSGGVMIVKQIRSMVQGKDCFEVTDNNHKHNFALWVVSVDRKTNRMDCTCEARSWCSHRAAVAEEIEAAEARMDAADRLAFSRGLY